MSKFLKISELSKLLNLVDPQSSKPKNHILRYWEKEFKEIKPKKINNQRYYSPAQVEVIKLINFLLKNQRMTIKGVKNVIKKDLNKLDDNNIDSLKADYYKKILKNKSIKILEKINKIKSYGKKNSS